jgi:multiple sugar transport system substrate-binding protein
MSRKLSRREMLKGLGVTALAASLYACQPKQQAPAEQPKAEQPKEEAKQPVSKEKPKLRLTLWAEQSGEGRTWPSDKGLEWAEQTGIADVEVEMVSYNEMPTKQLTAVAAGTLWDVMFNNNKIGPYNAFKNVYLWLDELIESYNTDMTDYFPAAVEGCTFEGKRYSLPCETNTGNCNIVFYNKDLLAEYGVDEPTDDWTFQEFSEMAAKATDKDKRIFGTNLLFGNYYDFCALARGFGGDLFSEDGKDFTLTTNPKTLEAMRAFVDLRSKYQAAPLRDESEGLNFYAGTLAIYPWGTYGFVQMGVNVEDRFEWGACLGPKGPGGMRGYSLFILQQAVGSTTKYPQEAYQLCAHLCSKEVATWSFVNQGQPTARLSVLRSPEAEAQSPVLARVADWMADGVNGGPFPQPYNLRFQEVQDTWNNLSLELQYGEVDFNAGAENVQAECQKIMELERG